MKQGLRITRKKRKGASIEMQWRENLLYQSERCIEYALPTVGSIVPTRCLGAHWKAPFHCNSTLERGHVHVCRMVIGRWAGGRPRMTSYTCDDSPCRVGKGCKTLERQRSTAVLDDGTCPKTMQRCYDDVATGAAAGNDVVDVLGGRRWLDGCGLSDICWHVQCRALYAEVHTPSMLYRFGASDGGGG